MLDMARTKTRPKRTGQRPSWAGMLKVGLVNVPVQAFNAAAKQEEIHFHQLHAACHRRIHYAKVCPVHGEVSNDEIVSAYEHAKGKYVEVEDEELESLRANRERALVVDAFVDPHEIDPIYYDGRVYYLVPRGDKASEPYLVLHHALEGRELYGLGEVVFSGKEQLTVVRPLDGLLAMMMLNYENHIRNPQQYSAAAAKRRPHAREVELAEHLIDAYRQDEFDMTAYEDDYQNKLRTLINAKIRGDEVAAPRVEEDEPEVINLMDALRRSVQRAQTSHGRARRSAGSQRRSRKHRRTTA